MTLTPEQRSLRARIAANARWSREDPTENALRGQRGLEARFEREVDPDGTLTPAERARRVQAARTAYMQSLALRSARTRQNRRASRSTP